jgi:hypothetical protein
MHAIPEIFRNNTKVKNAMSRDFHIKNGDLFVSRLNLRRWRANRAALSLFRGQTGTEPKIKPFGSHSVMRAMPARHRPRPRARL